MALCSKCRWATEFRFRNYLKDMNIDLEGSILDIACGPFSLGCIYNDVHGHDNSPGFVRCLEEMGIPACLADISKLDYPSNSFRYVVTFNPPIRPFRERGDLRSGIKRFLEEMLRIAQDKVIIRSGPIMSLLPLEYDSLIVQKGENYVIYAAQHHFHRSDAAMQSESPIPISSNS